MTAKELTETPWFKVLDRYGFPTLVAGVLLWMGYHFLSFAGAEHVEFLRATRKTMEQQAEIAQKQAAGQSALIDMTDDNASVLRSIKEDTGAIRKRVEQ